MNLDERLADVLEAVLGPQARSLKDEDGPGTIATWDSVNHLHLVLAVEAEFGVQFTVSDIADLLSVEKIRNRLRDAVSDGLV